MFDRNAIQRHEWPAVIVAFGYFFCVLAAYYIIRPVRDQLSAAVGSIELPIFYSVVFAVMLVLTPLFGKLVARFRRRRFLIVVYILAALITLAFVPLFRIQERIDPLLFGTLFFVWGSVFNLFVVAVFWSFMADLFDEEQARRLFPLIATGGPLGAITGAAVTKTLVFLIGVPNLVAISALLLCVPIVCIVYLSRWSQANPVSGDELREERIIGGNIFAGAVQTLRSPLLRRFATLMVLGDCVGTVIYALLADYSHATYHTPEARTDFSAGIDLFANLLQIGFQLIVTRELMVRFGAIAGIVLDGAFKAIMMLSFIAFGGAWIVAVAIVTRASLYGVFKPAADSLYTLVDAEIRYKGKNFIDTAVWRFGDVVVTSGFNAFRAIGVAVPGFALFCTAAAVASSWIGWTITRAPELQRTPQAPTT